MYNKFYTSIIRPYKIKPSTKKVNFSYAKSLQEIDSYLIKDELIETIIKASGKKNPIKICVSYIYDKKCNFCSLHEWLESDNELFESKLSRFIHT
jgi:hypothetical protein